MYTCDSKFFTPEFKAKSIAAIKRQIAAVQAYDVNTFGKMLRDSYGAEEIQEWGYRWKDAEQCFQAMVMRFGQKMRDERGPGMMTEVEAKSIERMHFGAEYLFDISAADGVAGAASCDHYYRFEKNYD